MIIVNTPHNPVGKVFTRQELEFIAELAEEHNLIIMSDEVVSHAFQLLDIEFHERSIDISTTHWSLMTKSTFVLPRSPVCGIAP